MTEARGCFPGEAAAAATLRARLDQQWGFSAERAGSSTRATDDRTQRSQDYVRRKQQQQKPPPPPPKPEQEKWDYDYEAARRKWNWEGRKCGKMNCWCSRRPGTHGPYRYAKKRTGRQVNSIYLGKPKVKQ
jgi:hypothetical protein